METAATIDEYIAAQPTELQPLLQAVRETIRAAAPKAQEKVAWQMAAFWQGEYIVHFAACKNHLRFFPGSEAISVFTDSLAGYKTAKGTIQFHYSKSVDQALITDIVRWRVEQASGGKSLYAEPVARERYVMPDDISAALEFLSLMACWRASSLIPSSARIPRRCSSPKNSSDCFVSRPSCWSYVSVVFMMIIPPAVLIIVLAIHAEKNTRI